MDFKEIDHLLELVRLELNEEEKGKISKDLAQILKYVSQLSKVDTKGVEPMNGGTFLENVMREDKLGKKEDKHNQLKKAAPSRQGDYFKTPPIV